MPGFKIGIEIEMLLRDLDEATEPPASLWDFAENFRVAYNEYIGAEDTRIHNDVEGSYEENNANAEWTLVDDITLDREGSETNWAIEITSPIFEYIPNSAWRDQVSSLWDFTTATFEVKTNKSCGLHVHLSPPNSQDWPIDKLQKLCRCIFWFENAFESLLPESRRANKWCKSNRVDNPKLKDLPGPKIFDRIDNWETPKDCMNDMCPGDDYTYGWNFTNLEISEKCTVEWRKGPGVTTEDAYLAWVELVASFACSAVKFGTFDQLADFPKTVEGLKEFIKGGAVDGMSQTNRLATLFAGREGAQAPSQLAQLTHAEQLIVQRKKKENEEKRTMVKKVLMEAEQKGS